MSQVTEKHLAAWNEACRAFGKADEDFMSGATSIAAGTAINPDRAAADVLAERFPDHQPIIADMRELLIEAMDFLLPCNPQDPALTYSEDGRCPKDHRNCCGSCDLFHRIKDALKREEQLRLNPLAAPGSDPKSEEAE